MEHITEGIIEIGHWGCSGKGVTHILKEDSLERSFEVGCKYESWENWGYLRN